MIIVLEVNHDQWNSIIMIIRIFSPKIISMITYSIIYIGHAPEDIKTSTTSLAGEAGLVEPKLLGNSHLLCLKNGA